MLNNSSSETITGAVTRSIADALLLPSERIIPSARLISDLGAESIDIADIRFRLEEELGIRIDQRQMTEAIGTNLTAEEFDRRFTVQFVIDYAAKQATPTRES